MSRDCDTEHVCVHENGASFFKTVPRGPCHEKARCRVDKKTRKTDCQCNKGLVGDGRTKCQSRLLFI